MLDDPRSGSKIWEAPDREIGKPRENRGQIVAHWEFQPPVGFSCTASKNCLLAPDPSVENHDPLTKSAEPGRRARHASTVLLQPPDRRFPRRDCGRWPPTHDGHSKG